MRSAEKRLSLLLTEARGGTKTLYYIGKRPAKPKPKSVGRWAQQGQPEPEWVRPWLDAPVQRAVFLTPAPATVAWHHGIYGHVYAYEVPRWVIKQAGGLHRHDKATEIVIPDVLWKYVKFKGKSMDQQEFEAKLKSGESERARQAHDQGFIRSLRRPKREASELSAQLLSALERSSVLRGVAERAAVRSALGEASHLSMDLDDLVTEAAELELHVFDFDGTLFKSPMPPQTWTKGTGAWFGDPNTLGSPYVPEKPGGAYWNAPVVARARKSIANPNVLAVMMTGRRDVPILRYRIAELLKQAGLNFDYVYLSTGGSTSAFKASMIGRLLQRNPEIAKVQAWDDRPGHFADFKKAVGARSFVPHRVKRVSMPSASESHYSSTPKKPKKARAKGTDDDEEPTFAGAERSGGGGRTRVGPGL